jgi:hypothetical protein
MLALLLWHYLQAVIAVVGLGFLGMIVWGIAERDYWLAVGATGAAAAILWIAGMM